MFQGAPTARASTDWYISTENVGILILHIQRPGTSLAALVNDMKSKAFQRSREELLAQKREAERLQARLEEQREETRRSLEFEREMRWELEQQWFQ